MKNTRKEARLFGEVRYFTGKPCSRGHISERWTCSSKCVACHYEENPLKNIPRVSEEEKKVKAKNRARRWYIKNRQETIDRAAKWKYENKDKVYEGHKRYISTPEGKSTTFMRQCIRRCLNNKTDRTHILLGYTKEELVIHLNKLMVDGMSWRNYGEWHIDHIIPVRWFIRAGVNDPKVINKLSNLRPLWAIDNLKRNRKL